MTDLIIMNVNGAKKFENTSSKTFHENSPFQSQKISGIIELIIFNRHSCIFLGYSSINGMQATNDMI